MIVFFRNKINDVSNLRRDGRMLEYVLMLMAVAVVFIFILVLLSKILIRSPNIESETTPPVNSLSKAVFYIFGIKDTGVDLFNRSAFTLINGGRAFVVAEPFHYLYPDGTPRINPFTAVVFSEFDLNDPSTFSIQSVVDGTFGTFKGNSVILNTQTANSIVATINGSFTPDSPGVFTGMLSGTVSSYLQITITRTQISKGTYAVTFVPLLFTYLY